MNNPKSLIRWLAIIWTVIMLIGCLTPHKDIPEELSSFNDKSLHIIIFVPFAILWILAGYRVGYVLVAGILFGALIEVLQGLLPINRNADWLDLAADSLGAVLGTIVGWLLPGKYKNHKFIKF